MVRMALKLWKLTLEPYQSFSEDDAPERVCCVRMYVSFSFVGKTVGDEHNKHMSIMSIWVYTLSIKAVSLQNTRYHPITCIYQHFTNDRTTTATLSWNSSERTLQYARCTQVAHWTLHLMIIDCTMHDKSLVTPSTMVSVVGVEVGDVHTHVQLMMRIEPGRRSSCTVTRRCEFACVWWDCPVQWTAPRKTDTGVRSKHRGSPCVWGS